MIVSKVKRGRRRCPRRAHEKPLLHAYMKIVDNKRIKSSKVVVETSDKKLNFIFLCPESIHKVDPAGSNHDTL